MYCPSDPVRKLDADWHILKIGKRAAGRLLDGVEHNEMPL
jgi:hypothetical protein